MNPLDDQWGVHEQHGDVPLVHGRMYRDCRSGSARVEVFPTPKGASRRWTPEQRAAQKARMKEWSAKCEWSQGRGGPLARRVRP